MGAPTPATLFSHTRTTKESLRLFRRIEAGSLRQQLHPPRTVADEERRLERRTELARVVWKEFETWLKSG
ncbi:hypothetical protein V6N12_048719 [Hibiscus sabdariffa]|uniref:Uncharacterized protein n=1 Tax=Hibiscus sabdariffa TaxID=183260 RepID=A0ABR2EI25_9ROSI